MSVKKVLFTAVIVTQALLSTLWASPAIAVDSSDFDAGTLYQGDVKKLEHTFTMRNTGDSTLTIRSVKASCGCTTVGFDSIIAPGKSGKVTMSVDLKNIHTGPFKKNITILSNAKNTPDYTASLGATMKSYISLSKENIQLVTVDKISYNDSLTLSTEKPDLAITSISFKMFASSGATPAWQSDLLLYPQYTLVKGFSDDKKYTVYKLNIKYSGKEKEPKFGEFTIKTNHPKVPEITVSGSIAN